MAKIDYSKSEKLLEDALLKMSVKQLLQLADKPESFLNPYDPANLPSVQARTIVLNFMDHDLVSISKAEGAAQNQLGITRKQLKKIIDNAGDIKLEDWKKIRQIREKVIKYKKDLWSQIPHLSDEDIVKGARKKTVNQRFNVRENWYPLH